MNSIIRTLIASTLLTISSMAYSADWIELLNDEDHAIYFDSDSVTTKHNPILFKTMVGAWFKFEYKQPKNKNMSSEKMMMWFNCKDKTISVEPSEYYAYNNVKKVTVADNTDVLSLKYSNIAPETIGEGMYNAVCIHMFIQELAQVKKEEDPKRKEVKKDILKDTYFRQIKDIEKLSRD